jgi:hypothetical protein
MEENLLSRGLVDGVLESVLCDFGGGTLFALKHPINIHIITKYKSLAFKPPIKMADCAPASPLN